MKCNVAELHLNGAVPILQRILYVDNCGTGSSIKNYGALCGSG
jgi:hypothetical protein